MNRSTDTLERRVIRICDALAKEIGVTDWYIRYRFVRDQVGADTHGMDVEETACVTKADFQYRQCKFFWYLPSIGCATDAEIEFIAIHEFCHLLMSPLNDCMKSGTHVDKLVELATENWTRAIMSATGRKLPDAS